MSKGKKGRFPIKNVLYPLALHPPETKSEDAFTATESRAEQTATRRRLPPKSWFRKNGYGGFLTAVAQSPETFKNFEFDPE